MPDVAKKAVLDLSKKKFYVDGEEFPWLITDPGPTLTQSLGYPLALMTLTLLADTVEVIPESNTNPKE
ncbi:hypothetical protein [Rhodococcus marinonascens]|uniref:hypothetical protein n=1 Tax=Rhodococcus marinonascens TaxID=38311 RepID=UPI0009356213|nr:hypothetical protein [Rhodococcus marinonascens]